MSVPPGSIFGAAAAPRERRRCYSAAAPGCVKLAVRRAERQARSRIATSTTANVIWPKVIAMPVLSAPSSSASSVPATNAAIRRPAAAARSSSLAHLLERVDQRRNVRPGGWPPSCFCAARRPPSARSPRSPCSAANSASAVDAAGSQAPRREVDRGAVRVERRQQLVDAARRRQRGDRDDGGLAAADRAQRGVQVRRARSAMSPRSALVTTSTSGISMIPDFRNWSTSPEPGCTTTATVSATSATSVSLWPTPTVSTTTTSNAAASAQAALRVDAASPPRRSAAAVERMKVPRVGGVVRDPRAVAEQRAARAPRRGVDREHRDRAPGGAPCAHELGQQRRLARARAARSRRRRARRPRRRARAAQPRAAGSPSARAPAGCGSRRGSGPRARR